MGTKVFKTVSVVVAVLAALIVIQQSLQAETIRMAWFAVPPHVTTADGGMPKGPSIDLFNKIAARMGCTVEWVGPYPISRVGQEQKAGKGSLDGTILHIRTAAVEPLLLYPRRAYFIARPCIAVRMDSPLKHISTIEDIRGFRIGFVKTLSLSYPPMITNNLDKVIIDDLTGENWTSRNLARLLLGRIDAVYERNPYTLLYQAALDGIAGRIRVLELPDAPIAHYFVFHRNSTKAEKLMRLYEKATAGMNFDYDAMVRSEIERSKRK